MFSGSDKHRLSAVGRLPCVSLLLAGIAVCLQFSLTAMGWLQYDPAAIAAGEVWRIVTCHLTHWSFDHLFWDATALIILGVLCETAGRRPFLGCMAVSAVLIPLFIWVLMPEVDAYRGLSGIDSAVFALLAITILRENLAAQRFGWVAAIAVVLCGFSAKIGFEYLTGQTVFVDSMAAQMVPIPLAHVVGGLVGAGTGLCGWKIGDSTPIRPLVEAR